MVQVAVSVCEIWYVNISQYLSIILVTHTPASMWATLNFLLQLPACLSPNFFIVSTSFSDILNFQKNQTWNYQDIGEE